MADRVDFKVGDKVLLQGKVIEYVGPRSRGIAVTVYIGRTELPLWVNAADLLHQDSLAALALPAEPPQTLYEEVRKILIRVDEDARGTRCLTMHEVTLCLKALRKLAALHLGASATPAPSERKEPFDFAKCPCRLSDAWRCARDLKLSSLACHCECHRAAQP